MSFSNANEIETYITAGNATLTFESEKTGAHYTFKVSKADAKPGEKASATPLYFVSLLTGPSNEADYSYLGILAWNCDLGRNQFRLTTKSRMTADAKPVRAFNWVWNAVAAGRMPVDCAVHHEGHCGRCGRTLTTPESIERGIGPECADKMGMVTKTRRRQPRASADVIRLADRMQAPQ